MSNASRYCQHNLKLINEVGRQLEDRVKHCTLVIGTQNNFVIRGFTQECVISPYFWNLEILKVRDDKISKIVPFQYNLVFESALVLQ